MAPWLVMARGYSSSPAAASSIDPVHTAAITDPAANRSAISAGSAPRAGFCPGAVLTPADPAATGDHGRRRAPPLDYRAGEPGAVHGAHLPRSALSDQRDLEARARQGRQRPEYVEGLDSVECQDFNVHGSTLARW